MSTFTTEVAGRIAVAAVLSLGITAGSIGIASASSNGHGRVDHASAGSSWTYANRVNGVVTGYVAGASITIAPRGGTTATTYTLTSATTIAGLATGASLVNNDVSLTLSTTTPTTVVSIKVEAPRVKCDGTNSHSPLSAHASDGHQAFGHGSNHHSSARFANFHR